MRSFFTRFRRMKQNRAQSAEEVSVAGPDTVVQHAIEDDEDQYTDGGEPDEDDRRNFRAIRAITRKTLEVFLLDIIASGDVTFAKCHITKRKEGSFHHCVLFRIETGEEFEQAYVLKIPAHGTPENWQESDAFMLRNEAVLVQHIRHHTKCPVPEVVAFDETLDNSIGVPYILMKELEGMTVADLWQGQHLPNPPELVDGYLNADDPSPELEALRVHFLGSLARSMSELQTLDFARIGIPVFEHPEDATPTSYGPVWRWHSHACMQAPQPVGPYITAGLFWRNGLDTAWSVSNIESLDQESSPVLEFKGVRMILNMVLSTPPFKNPLQPPENDVDDIEQQKLCPKKAFVLRHDDLDLQNILVDADGNVTGIIDFDGCHAAPRCVGYSSLPTFLRRDWLDERSMAQWTTMTWSLNRYRTIYASAMAEACRTEDGTPIDAQYTNKSAIYQAFLALFYDDEDCREVVGKLLAEIDDIRRIDVKLFCVRLGKGWPAAEQVLREKITDLLAPEV
jgi:serine/threonine protein kinase